MLLVIPFFFFIVLPQRRQVQAANAMHARLVVGDEVVMTSGVYGTIVEMADDIIKLEIAPNTVITIARRAVGRLVADLPSTPPSGDKG